MILDTAIPPLAPYPCRSCTRMIRTVERTTGGIVVLNVDPDPAGQWIPWPSDHPNGLAQARRMTYPIPGEQRWSEHSCR